MADCAWWSMGDIMGGKPALGFRINGVVQRDLIIGVNINDWDGATPGGRNTERVRNNDQYGATTYVTRLEFPEVEVTSLEIVLLVKTKTNPNRTDSQQVIQLYGVTLGLE